MTSRQALIIASYQYKDESLRQLVAPAQDAEALAQVLSDPTVGGFSVETLINAPSYKVNQAIENFFDNRKRDDLLLLYFSVHGIKDAEGRLYFATSDTRRKRLRSTAVPAALVNDVMRYSRSRRQVLLLDCCYSGAFAKGMVTKAEAAIGSATGTNEQLGGQGRVVSTASDALQYAFEGERVEGQGVQSVFTNTLVDGLKTGEADLDGNGDITLDELYNYVHDRVIDQTPQQRPEKWELGVQGSIIIAHNPSPVVKPVELPPELADSLEDPRSWVREGAVRELGRLLQGSHQGLSEAAREALDRLKDDDSRRVSDAATRILAQKTIPIRRKKKTAEVTPRQETYLAEKKVKPAPAVSSADVLSTQAKPPSDVFDTPTPTFRRWWRVGACLLAIAAAFLGTIGPPISALLLGAVGVDHARNRRRGRALFFFFVALFWEFVTIGHRFGVLP